MAIKFKNILVYIVYFFLIIIVFHVTKRILKKHKLNKQASASEYKTDLVETQYNITQPYTSDLYEPRFVAPRYYDSQFLLYQQPVYTRTFGNYPIRQKRRSRSRSPSRSHSPVYMRKL
jgi:hypothetical protein